MAHDKLLSQQSLIISLDVDALLFDKLKHIVNAGISAVEINSSDSDLLKKALTDFPSLRIGSGNVISTQQLEDCFKAGVHFATSPGFLPAIAQTASVYSLNYLPGVATLSEAMEVLSLGYHQIRPYPSELSFCALLNKCLPMLRQYPGEIEWEAAEHYLSLPSVAAVSILNPEIHQLNTLASGVLA